jgi:hypothetical protein
MGDPLAKRAMFLLQLGSGHYPGDDRHKLPDLDRFLVYHVSDTEHTIMDHEDQRDPEVTILTSLLLNPRFCLRGWYHKCVGRLRGYSPSDIEKMRSELPGPIMGMLLGEQVAKLLQKNGPYEWDVECHPYPQRFEYLCLSDSSYEVWDHEKVFRVPMHSHLLTKEKFNVVHWFKSALTRAYGKLPDAINQNTPEYDIFHLLERGNLTPAEQQLEDLARRIYTPPTDAKVMCQDEHLFVVELNGQQIPPGTYPALHRTSATTKDFKWIIPKPLVVTIHINGHLSRALIDFGLLSDFMSVMLADQLKILHIELAKPIVVQLAVQGSRSKVNFRATAQLKYQSVDSKRYFDIINLQNYDLVLGTPFLFQHQVMIGLNPPHIVIGSTDRQPMKGDRVTTLESRVSDVYEESLDKVREKLSELARPLCAKASETNLPPLCVINHTIPLIDEGKIYLWRPSRCPEPLRPQWADKRQSYLASGHWQVTSAGNTVPMLFIRKPGLDRLHTVVDLHERNKNTWKLISPLPDMDGILRQVTGKKFKSILDGQDAYKQIWVVPKHVHHTAMTTPDGNMLSNVLQQGDCNTPATYQALMNHLFSEFLGKWMDVYLDDIIIYSDTLHKHIKHVKTVLKILDQEKLYLSQKKLQFLCDDVKILGRIVGKDRIRMDQTR